MVYYIGSVLFLLYFCYYPCMTINVSIQYNGGLLPDIILLTQSMLFPSSVNPFKCHEEVSYLQPFIPPKRFFPLTRGCSEGLGAF